MKHYLARPLLGALCIGAAIGAGSLPASASPRHSTAHISVSAPRGIEAPTASAYLAGYTDTPPVGLASDSATFKVPKLTCNKASAFQGIALGVGDEATSGSPTDLAVAFLVCDGTTAEYDFDVLANGNEFVEPGPNPGDTVVASFYQTDSTVTSVIHDLNEGVTWLADSSPIPDTTATTGAFPLFSGSVLPVPKFAATTFTNCQLNGDYLGFSSPTQLERTNGLTVQIATSALPATSDTFKLTFKHS
jgi:hypothetical protein